jgi:hypothetical protein
LARRAVTNLAMMRGTGHFTLSLEEYWRDLELVRCDLTKTKLPTQNGNGNSVQLLVGDNHGKFVVEEELEVGL